jgi:hypothetical protein
MDIDEHRSDVDINEEPWIDIDIDGSDSDNSIDDSGNSIDDPTNNDSGDEDTISPPIQPQPEVEKTSKPTRTELRNTIWYRFKKKHLRTYKWLRFDEQNHVAYCSYPHCKA